MHQNEYKIMVADPCVFRKSVLEGTLRVLQSYSAEETKVIEKAFLKGIKKPIGHKEPATFDYYWVNCTADEADAIAGYLFEAEATAVPPSGETAPEASWLASLVDIWSNFRDWIEGGGETSPNF